MDFRELNLGTQIDEEGFAGKRAVFEDSEEESEGFMKSNTAGVTERDYSIKEQADITEDILSDTVEHEKNETTENVFYKKTEDSDLVLENPATNPVEVVRDTGEFSIEDIEGAPYARTGGRPIHHAEKKEPLYGTTAVAKVLGLSTQAIRNYCDYFEDYLQIQKKESGHRSFTYADIERLRQLVKLKDEKNLTFEQLKEYLKGPEQFEVIPESQRFETAIEKMEQAFEMSLKTAISYVLDSNAKLLEQKDEETQQVLNGVSEQLKSQDAAISQLIEIIKDGQSTSDEKLSKTIDNLQASLKERDERIEELVKLNEQKTSKIIELETKKQKKFFGLF